LVKEGIGNSIQDDLSIWNEVKVEFFSIEIELNGKKKYIISMVYKPPGAHLDDFIEGFNELLAKIPLECSHILMGDFDFNLLDLSGTNGDFLNFMISSDLYPFVGALARLTSQSETLIDNIFIQSGYLHRSFADVRVCPESDHLLLIDKIDHPVKKLRKKKVITRLMKKENLQNLQKRLALLVGVLFLEKKNALQEH